MERKYVKHCSFSLLPSNVGWEIRSNTDWCNAAAAADVWTGEPMGTCPSYVKRMI